ncbi:dihydrouridine synthase, putative [Plasmodium knowlesi strain H]|uniref:Dihydrouridine synthase, putative n=3 Tax=Plasmodium knowlesi TaxID=5850 RepID=A0A5K1UP96_PLAKH|nr:dihydrouridine synthase, putative [Plasmodium knowlesi strain H]OTN67365.1 putative Dihydrouridine synthase [Plasmodium knowlesi]CAA9987458.1 dihydrouridine synthase, putative [Plasmodium knowlesi strain H]SBO23230.1 dihydrouridine synthase, putative [Plasmodium knowlesi strain H]SBO24071.1 dihydrouridine synthase, putative [Plasmodium knowlesi strain H]VVS76932.1 dihydrouridine synthase, putative [Plasmodium knowlesi strain H]|eukprot:XP_002258459.1 dihydrouridine synthase, putative [Plasmodium knowlesi strain H]
MRVAPLRDFAACLYLARPLNNGQPKLNTQRRHPLVGAYYLDGDHNRENLHKRGKEKLWRSGQSKRNVYCFSNKSIRRHQKILKQNKRTMISMSVAAERNVEESIHLFGEEEFKLEDISTCLSDIFEKEKCENIPFIQVAPMINVTNRHFRAFVRTITRRAQLWTEMIVDNTLLYNLNNLEEYLGFNSNEHPVVCQLGGSDPTSLAEAAVLVEQAGYDEINLNVGCPSTKVANKGAFGAYLMKKPEHVRNIVYEIKRKVQIPVSVKIRTGVDDCDSFPFLRSFIECVSSVGCTHFIVHARKAWLKGLDPKQNRSVPPLQYSKVYTLCQLYPHLKFTLNGGIKTIEEAVALLNGYLPREDKCDGEKTYVQVQNYHVNPLNGVMLGRACMENTTVLSQTDQLVYNEKPPHTAFSRRTVLDAYKSYLEENSSLCSLSSAFELLKPILGILKGMPGHRIFRNKVDMYIRNYSSTLPCSGILEKAMVDVDAVAPGCLDLPLADYKLQQEYIKNY